MRPPTLAEMFEERFTRFIGEKNEYRVLADGLALSKQYTDFLTTAEAAIRADQDRVTRERVKELIVRETSWVAVVDGERYVKTHKLLAHLSANTESK